LALGEAPDHLLELGRGEVGALDRVAHVFGLAGLVCVGWSVVTFVGGGIRRDETREP
jgi:hypothetical protein